MVPLLKVILVLLTGVSFGVTCTPPNGDPKVTRRPPLSQGFTAQKGWALIAYYIATLIECVFILASHYRLALKFYNHKSTFASDSNMSFPFLSGALAGLAGGII
ncbi:hypothetical protein WG66_000105 [Moniliophthora roreri]|nr:hypothetical protein WG66_000105 [Moniliophthora roreri]